MSQTAVTREPVATRVGMLAYAGASTPTMIVSKIATGSIPAGRFVSRDTNDTTAKLPTATGNVTATGFGFVIYDPGKMQNADGIENHAQDLLSVMQSGAINVACETAWAFGGQVFVRFTETTGGAADQGKVRNDADGGKAVALPGARFTNTGAAAGIARVSATLGGGVQGPAGPTGPTGPAGPTGP